MQRPLDSTGRRLRLRTAAVAFAALALGVAVAPAAPAAPAPPPAPPSAGQVAALQELEKEAADYESAARDYRGTLTRIVQHHYEDRRRRVMAALDAEISIEKKGLRDAREEAIRKLEAFVAAHAGRDAHPEKTPDAMFRLAALYEERARTDADGNDDTAAGLRPAIAMYKRIVKEFPQYRELAGVYYYLGHALNDSSRVAEAQQVFRALVCHDRYPYPVAMDPKDPERDVVGRLPQDHDQAFWKAWKEHRGAPAKGRAAAGGEEATFADPFPEACQPVAQTTAPGQEPRYLAEAWWLIGDHHFNGIDTDGGPYDLNRAESAYRRSLKYKKPPVYGVALYKLAWTYFKQQRYEASVRAFVDLLRFADEEEKRTGDPGADFRAEAYTYIAGALTYLDFAGPGPDEPYSPRNDVLDVEQNPREAERKMGVAIHRVQDPKLIPQDRTWTVPVYRALAAEFRELGQHHNAIEVSELVLKKAPFHRDAPVVEDEVAESWEKLAAASREGTNERAEAQAKALAARTALKDYVGVTAWTEKLKDDPEAIHTAERLARGGLSRAAADHTNMGNALLEKAKAIGEKSTRDPVLERALAEYRLAAQAWGGLPADENAYEQQYWLADANHEVVAIQVALDRSPSPAEVDAARRSARVVRDSNEDDAHLQPAAWMVVDVAQQVLNDKYKVHERTGGREGLALRTEVRTTGSGDAEHVVTEPFPREVADAIAAREEYLERVPPARDFEDARAKYAYQIADLHFLYGQLDEAKKRFEAQYAAECKKTELGVKAWRRLLTMASLAHDVERVRAIAQGALDKPCGVSEPERVIERELARKALGAASYEDAKTAFDRAQHMPDGPERVAAWRKAASLYRATLEKAPDGDAAPEAAINGAYASKQAGDYDQAIQVYSQFIKAYGNEDTLARLERGDASVTPPRAPEPAKYAQRVGFLRQAHEALAAAHVSLFDLRRAGASYDAIAVNRRFEAPVRRNAARNAAMLYASLGDRDQVTAARLKFLGLDPPADQRAEIDWLVAAAELSAWDERGLDENGNRAARLKAIAAMDAYHAANKAEPAAAAYAVRAAYQSAKLRRAGHDAQADAWCKTTVASFEKFRAGAPVVEGRSKALGSPEADMAAECAYRLLDDRIKGELDLASGRPHYAGTIDKVVAAYDADLKKADGWHQKLQEVLERYQSPVWSTAVRARQGSLYDAVRTGLFFTREPTLALFTDREKRLLDQLDKVDPERADAYRQKRREDWRAARDRKLAEADEVMVRRYAEAVVYARAWKVRTPAVDAATRRLAEFTRLLGDVRLQQYTQGVVDPATRQPFAYSDGFFLRTRPGLAVADAGDALPAPLPAGP